MQNTNYEREMSKSKFQMASKTKFRYGSRKKTASFANLTFLGLLRLSNLQSLTFGV